MRGYDASRPERSERGRVPKRRFWRRRRKKLKRREGKGGEADRRVSTLLSAVLATSVRLMGLGSRGSKALHKIHVDPPVFFLYLVFGH